MLEKWNDGMAPFGQINAYGGDRGGTGFAAAFSYTTNAIIPLFHHSIIPGWNMQDGWLGIPYYQQFVEFPISLIIVVIHSGGCGPGWHRMPEPPGKPRK